MNKPFHSLHATAERRATFYTVLAFAIASIISFAGCADNPANVKDTPEEHQASTYMFAHHIIRADRGVRYDGTSLPSCSDTVQKRLLQQWAI